MFRSGTNRFRPLAIAFAFLPMLGEMAKLRAAPSAGRNCPIIHDDAIQKLIEHARHRDAPTHANWLRGAADLEEALHPTGLNGIDQDRLIRELAYFLYFNNTQQDRSFVRSLLWMLQIDSGSALGSLRVLTRIDDARVQEIIEFMIDDKPSSAGLRGRLAFDDMLDQLAGDPPTAAVRMMMRRHPSAAMQTLIFGYRSTVSRGPESTPADLKIFADAEHLLKLTSDIDDWIIALRDAESADPSTRAKISMLAKDDQWWARLYAVEVMQRVKGLRDENLLNSLGRDSDFRVASAARRTGDNALPIERDMPVTTRPIVLANTRLKPPPSIVPDPKIQTLLETEAAKESSTLAGWMRAAADLEEIRHPGSGIPYGEEKLVRQLVFYIVEHPKQQTSLATGIELWLQLSPRTAMDALDPWMDDPREAMQSAIRRLTGTVPECRFGAEPKYVDVEGYLCASGRADPPRVLVVDMMAGDHEDAAMQTLEDWLDETDRSLEANELRSLTHPGNAWISVSSQEPIPKDATTRIAQLARHPRWWARAYAARILLTHKELQTPALNAALAADPDPTVAHTGSDLPPHPR